MIADAPAPPHPPAAPPTAPPPPIAGTRIPDSSPTSSDSPPRQPPNTRPQRQPPIRPNLNRPFLLGVAVAFTWAVGTVGTPFRSLGWMLALAVLSAAVVFASARRPAAATIGVAGTAFIPWLAIRTSPWLITVDLLVAALLLLGSVSLPAAGALCVPVRHHVARILRSGARARRGPTLLVHEAGGSGRVAGAAPLLRRWVPSLLVGLGALAAALALLASGDALLASFLDVGAVPELVAPRLLAAAGGLLAFALLIGAIAPPGVDDSMATARVPAALPTLCAAIGLSAAIAVFAATQASAAVLGADFVKDRTGLTYAEYARGGFFQLVIVSAFATMTVAFVRSVIRRQPGVTRRFRITCAALTVGVVTTVVSSIVKLVVYADTFGLTMLRLYTVVFATWLGLVSVLTFVALLRPHRNWLAPTLIASVAIGAFAMNVANPEHLVAEHNLDRAKTTGKLDVAYLRQLSLDAAPVILERLADIDAITAASDRGGTQPVDAAEALRTDWCRRTADSGPAHGGLSFNLASSAAIDRGRSVCG